MAKTDGCVACEYDNNGIPDGLTLGGIYLLGIVATVAHSLKGTPHRLCDEHVEWIQLGLAAVHIKVEMVPPGDGSVDPTPSDSNQRKRRPAIRAGRRPLR